MATQQDLEAFSTQVTCPDDFDEFWAGTLEQLYRIPLKPALTAEPIRSNEDVHVFNATFLSLDGLEIRLVLPPCQRDRSFSSNRKFPWLQV